MDSAKVHFELFVRRRGVWTLALATADRREAFEAADEALARAPAGAVRLCKETRDATSGHFRPLVLMEQGTRPPRRASPALRAADRGRTASGRRPSPAPPACATPQDLYATPARQAIGRLLAGWFARNRVTPFELLHRADLAERLEACEAELSAALYNAALAEAAARGAALDPVRRALETLVRRTIEHIAADNPDVAFRFGAAVAARLGRLADWKAKLELVLDLIEAAPDAGAPAAIARRVLAQPLIDILGAHGRLDEILGADLAAGDHLIVLAQIACAPAAAAVMAEGGPLARRVPRLKGLAARLAVTLHARPVLARARRAILGRVLAAIDDEARLWPEDPVREVEGLQALAALLALCGRLVDQDHLERALAGRWRRLAGDGFIDSRLAECRGALEEVDVVLDLAEAAQGRGSAELLGRRLLALLSDRAFEQEARFSPDPLGVSLGRLAAVGARIRASSLRPEARAEAERMLRRLAIRLQADAAALCA